VHAVTAGRRVRTLRKSSDVVDPAWRDPSLAEAVKGQMVNCVPQGVTDCPQSTTPKTAARDCPQSTTPGSQLDRAEVTAEFADECLVDLHEVDR